jgi:plasmid maintenance system antidote protein VapI
LVYKSGKQTCAKADGLDVDKSAYRVRFIARFTKIVNKMGADPPGEKSFGELVRSRRLEKGLTIEHLATLVGKSKAYLSLVENGKREPTPRLIERLVNVLGGNLNDWKFLGLERDRLQRTLSEYPAQVQKFLRTMAQPGSRKR